MDATLEIPQTGKGEKPSVLVFEDEQIIRQQLSNYFEEKGVAVHAFANVDDAMKAISETQFDAAILDVTDSSGKPEGLQIRKSLKENQPDARIFVVSAY